MADESVPALYFSTIPSDRAFRRIVVYKTATNFGATAAAGSYSSAMAADTIAGSAIAVRLALTGVADLQKATANRQLARISEPPHIVCRDAIATCTSGAGDAIRSAVGAAVQATLLGRIVAHPTAIQTGGATTAVSTAFTK